MNLPIFAPFFSRTGSVVCFAAAVCLALVPSARAQQTPTEVYGPWNVIVLPDGPGLNEPQPGAFGGPPSAAPIPAELLAGHAKWSLSTTNSVSSPGESATQHLDVQATIRPRG